MTLRRYVDQSRFDFVPSGSGRLVIDSSKLSPCHCLSGWRGVFYMR